MNLIVFPPGRSWRFLLSGQTEALNLFQSLDKILCFLMGMKNINGAGLPVFLQHVQNLREISLSEVPNPVLKLRIEFRFHPGKILPFASNPSCRLFKTDLGGEVQKDHRITVFQTDRQSPTIVAVQYPAGGVKNFCELFIKLLRRNVTAIGQVPDLVKVNQRKMEDIPQSAAQSAFSAASAADHKNAFHGSIMGMKDKKEAGEASVVGEVVDWADRSGRQQSGHPLGIGRFSALQ